MTGEVAKSNPIRYAGYYYDTETQHYYLKARYYDPVNGNFLAIDPHPGDSNDPISQNGYTYSRNNPIMNVDPDGTFAFALAAIIPTIAMALLLTTTIYITYRGILWLAEKSSEYKDVTKKGSVPNRKTNVTKKQFEKILESNGWRKAKSKDGKTDIFTKKGAKYTIRDHANSHDGPTAEFFPRGSHRAKLKIRLGNH